MEGKVRLISLILKPSAMWSEGVIEKETEPFRNTLRTEKDNSVDCLPQIVTDA